MPRAVREAKHSVESDASGSATSTHLKPSGNKENGPPSVKVVRLVTVVVILVPVDVIDVKVVVTVVGTYSPWQTYSRALFATPSSPFPNQRVPYATAQAKVKPVKRKVPAVHPMAVAAALKHSVEVATSVSPTSAQVRPAVSRVYSPVRRLLARRLLRSILTCGSSSDQSSSLSSSIVLLKNEANLFS
jgi:hypothetical protein